MKHNIGWYNESVNLKPSFEKITLLIVQRIFPDFEEIYLLNMFSIMDTKPFISDPSVPVSMNGDPKEQWEEIHSILRNPIIATFEITEDLNLDVKAGMSALCEYSMLEDNPFPTYAVTKKEIQKLQIKKKQMIE